MLPSCDCAVTGANVTAAAATRARVGLRRVGGEDFLLFMRQPSANGYGWGHCSIHDSECRRARRLKLRKSDARYP
ncbi:hypothetical protein DM77_3580 [Burkholderia mallei]|nr:hypothetical protein DM77_3580 [Burkholderia mallei]